jgi:hypothetical protein
MLFIPTFIKLDDICGSHGTTASKVLFKRKTGGPPGCILTKKVTIMKPKRFVVVVVKPDIACVFI